MAMARMNELSVSVSPLENSPQLRSDEEFVQTMWVAVRYHYDTDMKPFTFSKLPGPEKLKWAIALRKFIEDNCKIEEDEKMKQPNGVVQVWRDVEVALDQTNVLALPGAALVAKKRHAEHLVVFSKQSVGKLEHYIETLRKALPPPPRNAAMLIIIQADNDD